MRSTNRRVLENVKIDQKQVPKILFHQIVEYTFAYHSIYFIVS